MNRILHLFEWRLNDITKELSDIKNQGFNCIQISPIQPLKEYTYAWWSLYQPCDLTIGNSWIGSQGDLSLLCNKAENYGIKIIADVVICHMAGKNNGELKPHEMVNKELLNNKDYWLEPKIINDWNNRYEVTHYSMGLPRLNIYNHEVQNKIIKFLDGLYASGVKGFRVDAAKNIALPQEGCDFYTRVMDRYKDLFVYSELIFTDRHLLDEYSKYTMILTESECVDNKKIAYFESHDSFLDDTLGYTKNMDQNRVIDEYVIKCKYFDNTLFYNRPNTRMYMDGRVKAANLRYI